VSTAGGDGLLVHREGHVTTLTISRPEARNALTAGVLDEIARRLESLAADPHCRVAILTGSGERAFAAGADLDEMRARVRDAASALAYDTEVEALLRRIAAFPLPLVAAINGAAIGTGCLLLQCCDVRIASDLAWIGIPAARLSILVPFPDVVRLTRVVGPARTADLLLTGRLVSAHEAFAMGLVSHVVPAAQLRACAREVAQQIAGNAPRAVRELKRLIRAALPETWPLPGEARESYEAVYGSKGYREALAALADRRPPAYPDE